MHNLYPEIEPYDIGTLKVDELHTLYYEQSGNPLGQPVVFLHGGPGAGANASHRRFFDPNHYRIVIFDQRGSGRSTPLGETRNNTTPLLIEDIEKIRRHLGIARWFVFGGSWGSTLALAYGECHPEQVAGLALRGIFLCRPSEIHWFLYGIKEFAPDAWRAFTDPIPPTEQTDLLRAYHRRIMDPDPSIHLPACRAWSVYEASCSTLFPSPETVATFANTNVALGLARMETHYFMNDIFLPQNFILQNINKIRKIPTFIVQGRYDLVCPPRSADDLHRHWPEARYHIIADAGHSAMEPGIRAHLVEGMNRFRDIKI